MKVEKNFKCIDNKLLYKYSFITIVYSFFHFLRSDEYFRVLLDGKLMN
jgi:hypothetical protein